MNIDDIAPGDGWSYMGYARACKPRVEALLSLPNLSASIRRQLKAVKAAMDDPKNHQCKGLDRLHYCLAAWEERYRPKGGAEEGGAE